MARSFITKYTDIAFSDSDINYKRFYYKAEIFWKYNKNNRHISRLLQVDFSEYVTKLYKDAMAESDDEDQNNTAEFAFQVWGGKNSLMSRASNRESQARNNRIACKTCVDIGIQ